MLLTYHSLLAAPPFGNFKITYQFVVFMIYDR